MLSGIEIIKLFVSDHLNADLSMVSVLSPALVLEKPCFQVFGCYICLKLDQKNECLCSYLPSPHCELKSFSLGS